MAVSVIHHSHETRAARASSVLAALDVAEFELDCTRIALPRPEIQLAVRFGPSVRRGLDAHALGPRSTAHRKFIASGHRAVIARLRLGTHAGVFGAAASDIAGRIVALEDLWGEAAAQRLYERLAGTRDMVAAAAILESAITERLATARAPRDGAQLALDCAARLAAAGVNSVAAQLGVSERHLRRVFYEAVGVSPKTFSRLTRFHRALGAARAHRHVSWARVAADSGYYDQAHLIAEFRNITGTTPQLLLEELRENLR